MRIVIRTFIALFFIGSLESCVHECATVYFLVSEISPTHNDSYILPLTDADDIAQARALIGDPDSNPAKIVVATIAPCENCDYPNRDLLNDGKRWSWCITGFEGFAENTIEIYDGWPTFVEDDLDGWIENTNGVIGFWAYTVTRELTPLEVFSGHLSAE
jgi:hypothetical protein